MAHPYVMMRERQRAARRAITCSTYVKFPSEISSLSNAAAKSDPKMEYEAFGCLHCNHWHIRPKGSK